MKRKLNQSRRRSEFKTTMLTAIITFYLPFPPSLPSLPSLPYLPSRPPTEIEEAERREEEELQRQQFVKVCRCVLHFKGCGKDVSWEKLKVFLQLDIVIMCNRFISLPRIMFCIP